MPARKTPMKSGGNLSRQPMVRKRSSSKAEFSPAVRAEVAARSGGRCEAGAECCTSTAVLMHHIRRRKQPDSSANNAMHLCLPCHLFIHANVALSNEKGWLLRSS